MSKPPFLDWDERFGGADYAYGKEPNEFLLSQAALFRPGMQALMPGDGEGRNGAYLASLGLDVLSVDQSKAGLAKAAALARERGAELRTELADLAEWEWPEASFDMVGLFYLHLPPRLQTGLHQGAARALKPGGMLLFEAFHPENIPLPSGGPKDPALLYTPEQLRAAFPGFRFQELERAEVMLQEGQFHKGPAVVTRALAFKP